MKKYTFKEVLSLAVCMVLFTAGTALAQPDNGGPQPGNNNPATGVPLDGGASLLLASGVALGLKKLRDRRQAR